LRGTSEERAGGHRTSNIEHRTPNIQRPTANSQLPTRHHITPRSMFGVRCWLFDVFLFFDCGLAALGGCSPYHRVCTTVVKPSTRTVSTFSSAPSGQMTVTASGRWALPKPTVTGSSD